MKRSIRSPDHPAENRKQPLCQRVPRQRRRRPAYFKTPGVSVHRDESKRAKPSVSVEHNAHLSSSLAAALVQQRISSHLQELGSPEAHLLPQPPGREADDGSSSSPVLLSVRSRAALGQLGFPGSDFQPLPPEQRPRPSVPLLQTQRYVLRASLPTSMPPLSIPFSLQIIPGTWSSDASVRSWRHHPQSRRSITSVPRLLTSRRYSRVPTTTRPSLPERPACTAGWRRSLDLERATSTTQTAPLQGTATCGRRCSPTLVTRWTAWRTSPSRLTSPTLPRSHPWYRTQRPPWPPDRSPIWGCTIRLRSSEVFP